MDTLSDVYEQAQENGKDVDFAIDTGVETNHGEMIMSPSEEELELFVDQEEDVPVVVDSNTDSFIMVKFP